MPLPGARASAGERFRVAAGDDPLGQRREIVRAVVADFRLESPGQDRRLRLSDWDRTPETIDSAAWITAAVSTPFDSRKAFTVAAVAPLRARCSAWAVQIRNEASLVVAESAMRRLKQARAGSASLMEYDACFSCFRKRRSREAKQQGNPSDMSCPERLLPVPTCARVAFITRQRWHSREETPALSRSAGAGLSPLESGAIPIAALSLAAGNPRRGGAGGRRARRPPVLSNKPVGKADQPGRRLALQFQQQDNELAPHRPVGAGRSDRPAAVPQAFEEGQGQWRLRRDGPGAGNPLGADSRAGRRASGGRGDRGGPREDRGTQSVDRGHVAEAGGARDLPAGVDAAAEVRPRDGDDRQAGRRAPGADRSTDLGGDALCSCCGL